MDGRVLGIGCQVPGPRLLAPRCYRGMWPFVASLQISAVAIKRQVRLINLEAAAGSESNL